jgi:hypothetical protein
MKMRRSFSRASFFPLQTLQMGMRMGQPRKLGPDLQLVVIARGVVQSFRQSSLERLRPIRFFGSKLGLAVLAAADLDRTVIKPSPPWKIR